LAEATLRFAPGSNSLSVGRVQCKAMKRDVLDLALLLFLLTGLGAVVVVLDARGAANRPAAISVSTDCCGLGDHLLPEMGY
jgi:hypothetical protein